jgi:hypothetical protein
MAAGEPFGPGDVVIVGHDASVQFAGDRALTIRIIRIHDWSTYDGWLWLDGYTLDRAGEAVERRTLFVREAGIRLPDRR